MEIKDIWDEFKDRINSPFFGSLIISWLLYNWKVLVILFFYKHEVLLEKGSNYVEAISDQSNLLVTYILPFFTALVYTVGYPSLKGLIKLHIAKIDSDTTERIYAQTDVTTVPVALFTETKKALKKREIDLKETYEQESTIRDKNDELNMELLKRQNEISVLKSTHLEEVSIIRADQVRELDERRAMMEDRVSKINDENSARTLEMQNSFDFQLDAVKKDLSDRNVIYQNTLTEKENQISRLLVQLGDSSHIITRLEQELDSARTNDANNAENFERMNQTIVDLNNQIEGKINEIAELNNSHLERIQEMENDFTVKLQASEDRELRIETELGDTNRELEYLKTEYNRLINEQNTLTTTYEKLLNELRGWHEKVYIESSEIGIINPANGGAVDIGSITPEMLSRMKRYIEVIRSTFPA